MPTDNPKISAYVPQVVYDRFKQFQEERKLPMSQAAIVIFAEYFGLQQVLDDSNKGTAIGGVTLSQIQEIETQLTGLESSLQSRLLTIEDKIREVSQVDQSSLISSLLAKVEELEANKANPPQTDFSSLLSELTSRLTELTTRLSLVEQNLITLRGDLEEVKAKEVKPDSDTLSGLPTEVIIDENHTGDEDVNTLQKTSIDQKEYYTLQELAQRLDVAEKTITNQRNKNLLEWSRKKDPDDIGWEEVEPRKFKPERELPSSLLGELK